MFEPENDLERALMRAATEPSARPDFLRALMDSQVFVVLAGMDGSIRPGPDGNATLPEGMRLTLVTATRGDQHVVPFFSAPSRARAWYSGDHVVAPDKTRD